MKISEWIKRGIPLMLFLCIEFAALFLGGRAFYTVPEEFSIGETAPYLDHTPLLPPQGWSSQQQRFTADGEYFNRIIFSVMSGGEKSGGFTASVRDEQGRLIAAEHYTAESSSGNTLALEIQKPVTKGASYCFEVAADDGGASWAVPYLFVPGGELSWLDDAGLDGAPMGGGSHYLFLSFYFARVDPTAVLLHFYTALAGTVYLLILCFQRHPRKNARTAGNVAALCLFGAASAGQYLLCKNYYLVRTMLLCLPGVFLIGWGVLQIIPWEQMKAHFRLSLHSRKSYVALAVLLLSGMMLYLSIKERFDPLYFQIAVIAFLAFLFLSVFSTPRFDRFCARFPWLVGLAESILIFLQMEIANANPFIKLKFWFAVWNMITIFAVFAVLWALLGNFRRAGFAGITLFAVWGIANYFTVAFRGIPIAPNDLMSAGTALNVLSSYPLTVKMGLTATLLLIFLELLLLFRLPSKAEKKQRPLLRGAVLVCAAVFFWQGYFGSLSPMDMGSWVWNWAYGYYPQGYVAISIGKINQLFTKAPAGYTAAEAMALCEVQYEQIADDQTVDAQQPNIILILNESWFDWRQVTEFGTDRPVMPFIDSLENCVKGFAVVPGDGGGTSLSEYELLTSNSLSMMPEITPFTQRDLESSFSVVPYLEALGYSTAAVHPGLASNYNRGAAYPQLGFDRFHFYDDALFQDAQHIHGFVSDSGAFGVIEKIFEEKDADVPGLIYLLTIQNHGGYGSTEKTDGVRSGLEKDTVNLESGFEEVKNAAEEYLSLVHCTDAAFGELVGYFEHQNEPTIICMVGDHRSSLGGPVASPYEGYEGSLRLHGTPFVIWANYLIESYDAGYIGMVQLAPLLMKTAGLPLSPYYQTILDLSEEYPVLGAAFCRDADGNFGGYSYTEEIPQSELLKQYVYFEYNSLLPQKQRIGKIFLANG